jgi:transaldolase
MTMTKLHELSNLGQAVWLDFIRRSFVESGELQALINDGVRGVTSNPTIFEKAIGGSEDYDADIRALVADGKSVDEIYEALVIDDIAAGADLFRPLYDETRGGDGFISLEVSPILANDTAGTIADAKRLFATLGRPNVMIKIPGTPDGIPAITEVIGSGVNVNVTLMFSLAHYEAVVEAYLAGLEQLAAAGGDLSKVASVASFFVSRVDTAVDKALDKIDRSDLVGLTAIANAKVTYARFKELFSGPRWEKLAAKGANVQRPLWASTGTKDARFSDTLYVDTLIGPHTVNTMPPATLDAFRDHGTVASTVEDGLEEARAHLAKLAELGIDLDAITEQLQVDGVSLFAKSFESLMASIATKREAVAVG